MTFRPGRHARFATSAPISSFVTPCVGSVGVGCSPLGFPWRLKWNPVASRQALRKFALEYIHLAVLSPGRIGAWFIPLESAGLNTPPARSARRGLRLTSPAGTKPRPPLSTFHFQLATLFCSFLSLPSWSRWAIMQTTGPSRGLVARRPVLSVPTKQDRAASLCQGSREPGVLQWG